MAASPRSPPLRAVEPRVSDNAAAADEESPLLASHVSDSTPAPENHPHLVLVATVIIISLFLIEIGEFMMRAPVTRFLEDIICRAYYESTKSIGIDLALPIPEDQCKIAPIQRELALVKGWDMTLACIPGLLLAVPYGVLADKYGRKLVWGLSSAGLLLGCVWVLTMAAVGLPARWLWAGDAFLLIGGGSAVIKSTMYAILSDVASEDQRAAIFFRVNAAALMGTVVGVPLAYQTMKMKSPFVSMVIGTVVMTIGFALPLFPPETLKRSKVSGLTSRPVDQAPTQDQSTAPKPSVKQRIETFMDNAKDSHFMFKSPMLFALMSTFLLQSLGGYSAEFLYLLASERFNWSLGGASFLIPIGSVTNFVILIVVLPAVYHLLTTKFHLTAMLKDLIVARFSVIALIAGSLVIAWAPLPLFMVMGTMLYACGVGFASTTRSLVTSLVHPDQVSRLYAIMAIGDTVGTIIYGPILSKTFGWGMDLGGPWTGMTFIFSAVLYLVLGSPVWLVREPTPEMDLHG